MSTRALAGSRKSHQSSTGRVTPSKLRRTAVVAVDGVLAVGTGALAGVFGAGAASAAAPTPGWTGLQTPVPTGSDAPATNPGEAITTEACRDRRLLCWARAATRTPGPTLAGC